LSDPLSEEPGDFVLLPALPGESMNHEALNHEAFASRTRNALRAKSAGQPDEAVTELRALLYDLAPATKAGVTEWHQQQAMGLLVDALDAAGKQEECRAAWEGLIQLTRDAAVYWDKALSSALEDFARWSRDHPRPAD